MGERADAEVDVTAGRYEAAVPISSVAAAVVHASQPGVETVGSSGGLVLGVALQPSTTLERP